jgi:hypothetical protein
MKIIKELSLNNPELIEIDNAIYLGNYVINIYFNDGVSKEVDFKPFLSSAIHPAIKDYLDETKFKQFKIVNGNLNWNDYDLIFPIADLYQGTLLKQKK